MWHQKRQKGIKFSRCTGSGSGGTFPILSLEPLKTLGGHGIPTAHGIGFKSVPLDSQINRLNRHFGYFKISLGQKNALEEISKWLVITAWKTYGSYLVRRPTWKPQFKLESHNLKWELNKIMLFSDTHLHTILVLLCTFREWRIRKYLFFWISQHENVLMLEV